MGVQMSDACDQSVILEHHQQRQLSYARPAPPTPQQHSASPWQRGAPSITICAPPALCGRHFSPFLLLQSIGGVNKVGHGMVVDVLK